MSELYAILMVTFTFARLSSAVEDFHPEWHWQTYQILLYLPMIKTIALLIQALHPTTIASRPDPYETLSKKEQPAIMSVTTNLLFSLSPPMLTLPDASSTSFASFSRLLRSFSSLRAANFSFFFSNSALRSILDFFTRVAVVVCNLQVDS